MIQSGFGKSKAKKTGGGLFQTTHAVGGERWGDVTGAPGPPEEILRFGCGFLQTFTAEEFECLCHRVATPGDFLEAS